MVYWKMSTLTTENEMESISIEMDTAKDNIEMVEKGGG
jgi:hypothetical protein